ncbi:MAG: hypothetical protein WAO02_02590 [Verrucomicrobiia bacterium]
MKNKPEPLNRRPNSGLTTELLILPDGRILVHNLTPVFAGLLRELNPDDEQISSRVTRHPPPSHELQD